MSEWKPIETAPKDGGYILANNHGQVAFCDAKDGSRIVHNIPGFIEWEFLSRATHWQPLPPAPPALIASQDRE